MAASDDAQQIHDAYARRRVRMLRVAHGIALAAVAHLDSTEDALRGLVGRVLPDMRAATGTAGLRQAIDSIRAQVLESRSAAFDAVREEMRARLDELAADEVRFAAMALMAYAGGKDPSENGADAEGIVDSVPVQGMALDSWIEGFRNSDAERIVQALSIGAFQEETDLAILRRVIGTATANGADGATEATRRSIDDLSRTAAVAFAEESHARAAAASQVAREMFVAVLDSRTTPICRSLGGRVYPLGGAPRPPLHFNCRSTVVPIPDGAAPPPGTSYQEWLRRQPAEFQDDVLGEAKGRLFRDGGLPLDRFVDMQFQPLTLAELAARERPAFIAAGLDPSDYAR